MALPLTGRSGLISAVNSVASFFTASGVTATVEVGWRRRERQDNQGPGGANRVIFSPSYDDTGAAGTMVPVRYPGDRTVRDGAGNAKGTIRSLADWERKVLVSVWAIDAANQTSEAAQIEATETLFEWTMRAVHAAPGSFANAIFGDIKFTPPETRPFGLELLAALTFRQPIYDTPRDFYFPSSGAVARGTYAPPVVPTSRGDT